MNTYNGIPISELRLLVHIILFMILFLGCAVVLGFGIHIWRTMKSSKERQHIKRLKAKAAQNDQLAQKQLQKIERKKKRRWKHDKEDIVVDILIWGLTVCLCGVMLGWAIIPGWMDYIKKDYVVYTGEIAVCVGGKRSYIKLEDGTTVWGRGDFDDEDTRGTVVYSRRTKQFLGGNK